MNKVDWDYLKLPLIIFLLSAIAAAVVAFGGHQYELLQVGKYESAVSKLRGTHKRYTDMVHDIELLGQYRGIYSDYKESGLVGEERRLSWIESLETTNQVLKLPVLTYNLLPQEKFIRPGLSVKNKVKINSSPMELTMELLHEEDLLAVLEGLRLSIKSLFTVESCTLIRNASVGALLNTQETNLTSKCMIRWVTIDVK